MTPEADDLSAHPQFARKLELRRGMVVIEAFLTGAVIGWLAGYYTNLAVGLIAGLLVAVPLMAVAIAPGRAQQRLGQIPTPRHAALLGAGPIGALWRAQGATVASGLFVLLFISADDRRSTALRVIAAGVVAAAALFVSVFPGPYLRMTLRHRVVAALLMIPVVAGALVLVSRTPPVYAIIGGVMIGGAFAALAARQQKLL